ncbi:hypothetical protein GCM10027598_82250 [Amycolatopsis oliviviridis]|uniref:Uncharacterized protein n=1 Tax=Amycolatopsis oliviviridis TaxID=1471590 RepID=A0ABQ3L631_9PSEU|nr:hypothetical protein [Amycolatopsis oliviviridis]GHH06582.1 hypothetical protein GCM10017790_12150 [Amycolatopsis oliviviridis]
MKWTYDDHYDGISHLDAVFLEGNAPRLSGMLRSLAEFKYTGDAWPPKYIDMGKVEIAGMNDGELRSGVTPGDATFYDEYSILQGSARGDGKPDLSIEQFFYHADILSGQDVGDVPEHANLIRESLKVVSGGWIERALDRVEAARMGQSHPLWVQLVENFTKDGGYLWQYWKGEAATAAMENFAELHLWYGDRDPGGPYRGQGLGILAQCLLGFAAVIHGARLDIDNLMGACVRNVHAWDDETESLSSIGWSLLSGITGVITGVGLEKAIEAISAINEIAEDIKHQKSLQAGGCYDILEQYLREADDVLDKAVAGVEALTEKMRHIRDEFENAAVPKW